MIDGRGGDSGEARGRKQHATNQSTQQTMPNNQTSKPPMKTQATADFETNKNHPRDSLFERASTARNAIQLMRRVAFKDLTSTIWSFLQQNLESVVIYIKDTEKKRNKTRENA